MDDSEQVLTLSTNRGAASPALRFRRGCPFYPALRNSPVPRAGLL